MGRLTILAGAIAVAACADGGNAQGGQASALPFTIADDDSDR